MTQPKQLGFGFDQLLEEAESAHLPATMAEGVQYYRKMIEKHHTAMMAGNEKEAMAIRKEAHRLAEKLNGGDAGILANPDSPGYVLERETAAAPGAIPLWGQEGDFTVKVGEMPVRVKIDGMFGLGGNLYPRPSLYDTRRGIGKALPQRNRIPLFLAERFTHSRRDDAGLLRAGND